jgi:hypothetical protein
VPAFPLLEKNYAFSVVASLLAFLCVGGCVGRGRVFVLWMRRWSRSRWIVRTRHLLSARTPLDSSWGGVVKGGGVG